MYMSLIVLYYYQGWLATASGTHDGHAVTILQAIVYAVATAVTYRRLKLPQSRQFSF